LEKGIQYYPTAVKKVAVTLVVHGLNVKPVAMEPLINWLNTMGSDVYLVKLSGHYQESVGIEEVTTSIWQEEMVGGYEAAQKSALLQGLPLYFLGYSLGALLGQNMLSLDREGVPFDKQVLLAPATAIRPRSYLVKLLFFLDKRKLLPSFTPEGYRANKALPLRVYEILFTEEERFKKRCSNHLNIPTLVILDPKDELISYSKLVQQIKQYQLTNYQVLLLTDGNQNKKGGYHHLILDEETMGPSNWERATKAMSHHLFNNEG
jgi:esterase/lipase